MTVEQIECLPTNGASEDFRRMVAEFGLTESTMHDLAQIPADLVEFPDPAKVTVAPSKIHGHGLFATRPIASGEVITPARIVGRLTPAARYTNHAKHPNAELVIAANGDLHELALRDIAAGDEITNDYRVNARVFYASVTGCPLDEVTPAMVRDAALAALEWLRGSATSRTGKDAQAAVRR